MADPIWKDKYISIGSTDGTLFRIKRGSDVIYEGKGVKQPGASASTNLYVRVNDICCDWLRANIPTLDLAVFENLSFPISFTLQKSTNSGSSWSDVSTFSFFEDWSYDYHYAANTNGMAFPITGRVDLRQWMPFTSPTTGSLLISIFFTGGTSTTKTQSLTADPIGAPSQDDGPLYRALRSAGVGSAMFTPSGWYSSLATLLTIKKFTIQNATYYPTYKCTDWCVYYRNAYGGIDTLLLEGGVVPGDSLTRYENKLQYNNTDMQARGTQQYVNEVERTFVLHPGPLNSDEASRMHHLLNSPDVFLCQISTNDCYPILLTDNSHEYRTVRQNGQRMVEYTINAKAAAQFERR